MPSIAQDIQELMSNWNTIMNKVKLECPNASEDEQFSIASSVMNLSLKIKS